MSTAPSLLFLTDFSEACFQAIPTVSDWIDREPHELTLLHVHAPGRAARDRALLKMASFFAEADRYGHCERTLLEGDPRTAAVEFCRRARPAIVFAPAIHPRVLPRFLHRSLRATLLREAGVRLWTRGRASHPPAPRRTSADQVVYVLSGQPGWPQELQAAAAAARAQRARFHVVRLTPPQEIHDGTLAADLRIGPPGATWEQLLAACELNGLSPEIHSSLGEEYGELRRLLCEIGADVVFLGERHALRRGLFGTSFNQDLEELDCEVVCFPARPARGYAERAHSREQHGMALPAAPRISLPQVD